VGRRAGKNTTRAKTSTLHITPETPSRDRHRHNPQMRTPQAPRRRGDDEAFHGRCPIPRKMRQCARPKAFHTPHRQRHHLRPGGEGSAGSALPSTTCPTETNHRTEHSNGKRRSPLTPKALRRAYEKHKDPQEARRRPTRLRAPATSPENLLQCYDLSLALY